MRSRALPRAVHWLAARASATPDAATWQTQPWAADFARHFARAPKRAPPQQSSSTESDGDSARPPAQDAGSTSAPCYVPPNHPSLEQRRRRLEEAMANIDDTFGKGTIFKLGTSTSVPNTPVISTGSIGLDNALGAGGLPRGRVVEIFGPEASGKTTLALHVIAEAQKLTGQCVFIDVEGTLDRALAERIGVDTGSLALCQPNFGEEALGVVDRLVRSNGVDVVVLDSVSALSPRSEVEGEVGDPQISVQARLMSQGLRRLTNSLQKSDTLVIFLNQTRQKVSTWGSFPQEVTSGGNALKFYASVRLQIKPLQQLKVQRDGKEQIVGVRTQVKVVKNKVGVPYKVTAFDMTFGEGISREGELIDLGLEHRLVRKSGAYFYYGEQMLGQGKENAKEFLKGHPDVCRRLADQLRGATTAQAADEGMEAGAAPSSEAAEDHYAREESEEDLPLRIQEQ